MTRWTQSRFRWDSLALQAVQHRILRQGSSRVHTLIPGSARRHPTARLNGEPAAPSDAVAAIDLGFGIWGLGLGGSIQHSAFCILHSVPPPIFLGRNWASDFARLLFVEMNRKEAVSNGKRP